MLDMAAVTQQIEAGFIKAIPCGNLTLYNYTQHAQFERHWTPETLACRGLVMRGERIIARPFRKFFNLGERVDDPVPAETPELAEKLDGSLLIVFHDGDNWRACTKGAWANAQIDAAYAWLEDNAHKLDPAMTWLFELVAPWNRIVVSYPDERMILIGVVDTETGSDLSYAEVGTVANERGLESVGFATTPLDQVDLSAPFNNSEGYVARFSCGHRVKLKFEDYKRIHAVLSSASTDFVVDAMIAGRPERLENMPDEFMDWLKAETARVQGVFDSVVGDAERLVAVARNHQAPRDRAAVVLAGPKHAHAVAFNKLAGKEWVPVAWKAVKQIVDKRLWRPASATASQE